MSPIQSRFPSLAALLFISLNVFPTAQAQSKKPSEMKIGLVLDKGGKDDKSFNSAAFAGIRQAEKEFNIATKTVEATDDNAFEPLLRTLAERKYDLIVAVGFAQAEALKKVSAKYPHVKFAIVDTQVDGPNVRSLLFQEHEGSFLVGAIAGMKSQSGKIGFVGGMEIPLIRRFQLGFESGAKHINPKIQVVSNYIGSTSSAWNNPPKGKELAMGQYSSGVDVIYAAAGASGLGVFDAAEEKKKFAIGVDSNQNALKPGFILTSMLKRVDVGVYSTCKDFVQGKFTAGVQRFGLENQGIDFSIDEHNKKILDAETIKKANQIKADIISGKIKVPDFYLKEGK
jgi:basic membrane protein A